VKHFHEQGVRDHRFSWGYTWTKTQLHTAGLVERARRRGAHRRKRERKPCEGMMLHQDGSRHRWLQGEAALDLIVTMDDATSTIYSAFLVEEEGTASTLRGLLEVFVAHGLPCALYSDRGFAKPAAIAETAFVAADAEVLRETLCSEDQRVVGRDNTVAYAGLRLQLPQSRTRAHYVKASVKVREYPDGTLAIFHGPRRLARYDGQGNEIAAPTAPSMASCSPPSRRGLEAASFAAPPVRRPALTASRHEAQGTAWVGTKKRASRSNKETALRTAAARL
jgi:hypothetical protein